MYEYTDDDGDNLHVESSTVFGQTYIGTAQDNGPATGVLIHNEDAPAIALAILEAAGHGGSEAAGFVRGQVEALAKKTKREAEDAKVVEFHTAIGANLNRIERHHRDLYNAARRFFEEA